MEKHRTELAFYETVHRTVSPKFALRFCSSNLEKPAASSSLVHTDK